MVGPTVAWVISAIFAALDGTLWILLLWSIPMAVVMVFWPSWMWWHYSDEVHTFTLPRPRRLPHLSPRQRQAHTAGITAGITAG